MRSVKGPRLRRYRYEEGDECEREHLGLVACEIASDQSEDAIALDVYGPALLQTQGAVSEMAQNEHDAGQGAARLRVKAVGESQVR